ncbi:hypothetical protein O0L34_g10146 [Tuta absoluta]|nr:hypothetical protein O0L34_g10146 [Tuta absoluta]
MTTLARRREHDSGDYSDASHHENDQDTSGNGAVNDESDYDSAASDSEPSERDPESQETERRVDDDEDRSNPQYIPKRGTFYEHDDRTADNGGEESANTRDGASETASEKKEGESPAERRRGPRKSESVNKWSHDKYNENEQAPKSRDELVAIYGYDIRNEDAPPHARRNRRYGRGPNKYTRTWEDEEAYKRQANAAALQRKPPNPEDFPELDAGGRGKRAPRPRSKSQPSSNESIENGNLRRNASIKDRARGRRPLARTPKDNKKEPKEREGQKDSREKLPPLENLTITATVVNNSQSQPARKVNATVAQQRPVPTEQGKKKPPPPTPQQQPPPPGVPNKSPPQTTQPQKPQPDRQQTQPQEPRGSKRYSSLRQRPLDTYSPPQQQQQQTQQQRYHGEFPAASQHQGSPAPQQVPHPQQLMQQMRNAQVNQQHGPSPPHQMPQQQISQQQMPQQQLAQQQLPQQQLSQQQLPQQQLAQQQLPSQQLQQQQIQQQQMSQQQQQVRLGILEQQQQLVSHPHHNMQHLPPQVPQHSIAQLQQTQAYAPPAMMPAQYMQQMQGAAMYAAPPPAPYPHQLYQHHSYVNAVSIAETPHNYVQPAGGVTYYNCAEQETLPRATRRPTAAIPIVKPATPERPANSSEKDNIDRIVENMFVRKPWPNNAAGVDSKEKSEPRSSQEPQSKESSQPNSLTSSSISIDSKPSESIEKEIPEKEREIEVQKEVENTPEVVKEAQKETDQKDQESISTDA